MAVKLIVVDMDETFLRTDKTYDKEKATTIFTDLVNQGMVLAIASGNFVPLLEGYFDEDILNDIYLAGDDGNVLKNADGILKTVALERSDAEEVFTYIEDKEGYYTVFSAGNQAYAKGPVSDWVDKQISLYFNDYIVIDALEDIPADQSITKIAILSEYPLSENKQLMKQIDKEFTGVSSVTSGEEWLDVYHKDGGKGEAVKILQNKYNIAKEETMCFGDSLNDLSMMKEAHYSLAMENADDELKEHSQYEIGNNEEQSVLTVLEQLLENENLDFLEKYRQNHSK